MFRLKKIFFIIILLLISFSFLQCKKWKEDRNQKLIVGGWNHIVIWGHYNRSFVFTEDGKYYVYSPGYSGDDCSRDSIEEGPYNYTITNDYVFIVGNNFIDTLEIKTLNKSYFYFRQSINGQPSTIVAKYKKCE